MSLRRKGNSDRGRGKKKKGGGKRDHLAGKASVNRKNTGYLGEGRGIQKGVLVLWPTRKKEREGRGKTTTKGRS